MVISYHICAIMSFPTGFSLDGVPCQNQTTNSKKRGKEINESTPQAL